MILSTGIGPIAMPRNRAITPEYLYYFEAEGDSREDAQPEPQDRARPDKSSLAARIGHALLSGLAKICLLLIAIAAPLPDTAAVAADENPVVAARGADTLRAQMSALRGELSDLKRLQRFLGDLTDADGLARAKHLIETMPPHEKAGDAAWRIAAITSLNLESGIVSSVDIDNGYRLGKGAIGWDFGPDGATVHRGFTPVTPTDLGGATPAKGVRGTTPLTDGIAALESFQGSLPNGLYRVLIIRDGEREGSAEEAPFGGEIVVNGAKLTDHGEAARRQRHLSDGGNRPTATDAPAQNSGQGVGIQGWAIVEHGVLRIDFAALPAGRMITAVVAEPFDIDKIDLEPRVAETLAQALGYVAPAAGPAPRTTHRRSRKIHRAAGIASQQSQAGEVKKVQKGNSSARSASRGRISSASGTRFATSRRAAAATSPVTSPAVAQAQTSFENFSVFEGEDETGTPAFEDRELLIKRSVGGGEDSDGMAIDLGAVLDDASVSGTFLCPAAPCSELPPLAPEPDLAAAGDLLGDWLEDPTNLSDDWTTLEAVLALRESGSEMAVVYEFDVDEGGWTDLELRVSAGSGIFVWLNGDYIFGASDNGGFVDDLDFEYRIELPDLTGGTHFLQVVSESHIDEQGFALELRGTPVIGSAVAATSVNEPGALFLLGVGLLCFALIARRHVSPREDADREQEQAEAGKSTFCARGDSGTA